MKGTEQCQQVEITGKIQKGGNILFFMRTNLKGNMEKPDGKRMMRIVVSRKGRVSRKYKKKEDSTKRSDNKHYLNIYIFSYKTLDLSMAS